MELEFGIDADSFNHLKRLVAALQQYESTLMNCQNGCISVDDWAWRLNATTRKVRKRLVEAAQFIDAEYVRSGLPASMPLDTE